MSVSEIQAPEAAIGEADSLAAGARLQDAIDVAVRANRTLPTPELETRIRDWRHLAFLQSQRSPPASPSWPPPTPDPFPGLTGLPEIHVSELTSEVMAGAILHHGCLIVRELAAGQPLERLVDGIDRALADAAAFETAGPTPWYDPFPLPPESARLAFGRAWCRGNGVVWMGDSPRMMTELVDLYRRIGLVDVIARHLGEPPAISLAKASLRRTEFANGPRDWHQDGAFLGPDVRTINCWLGLSSCGEDAPGLDIVARRFDHIVQTDDGGESWWVDPAEADRIAGEVAVVSPRFKAGDGVLFDHLCLHRTAVRPGMTRRRWALECWFFAPSTYPMDQVPFAI